MTNNTKKIAMARKLNEINKMFDIDKTIKKVLTMFENEYWTKSVYFKSKTNFLIILLKIFG